MTSTQPISRFDEFKSSLQPELGRFAGYLGLSFDGDTKSLWFPVSEMYKNVMMGLYEEVGTLGQVCWVRFVSLNNRAVAVDLAKVKCMHFVAKGHKGIDGDSEDNALLSEPFPLEYAKVMLTDLGVDVAGFETNMKMVAEVNAFLSENGCDRYTLDEQVYATRLVFSSQERGVCYPMHKKLYELNVELEYGSAPPVFDLSDSEEFRTLLNPAKLNLIDMPLVPVLDEAQVSTDPF